MVMFITCSPSVFDRFETSVAVWPLVLAVFTATGAEGGPVGCMGPREMPSVLDVAGPAFGRDVAAPLEGT